MKQPYREESIKEIYHGNYSDKTYSGDIRRMNAVAASIAAIYYLEGSNGCGKYVY